MRNIIIAVALVVIVFASCKKNQNTVSTEVTYSVPTIQFAGGNIFFSIPVNGALPVVSATAYDSFYQEHDSVIVDQSTLDNTTPGLYIVTASAKNRYGMIAYASVYVAVTNIPSAINLAGGYTRVSNGDSVLVMRLANGLYETNNVGGVLYSAANAGFIIPAFFVQTDDTTIILPSQTTPLGALYGSMAACNLSPADTTFQYVVNNSSFGTSLRIFLKY
jgi:hypothetical protein